MENKRDSMREMMAERADAMRQQAMSVAEKRKQEYLGARVPKALREKILLKAEALGIPVSILIRNILTEYIENIGAEKLTQEKVVNRTDLAEEAKKNLFDEVIGWEKLTLNKEVVCSCCTKQMNKGDEVVFGVVPGKSHVILCELCKSQEGIA